MSNGAITRSGANTRSALFTLLMLILLCGFISACEDEKEQIIHWQVYRENLNGDYTVWSMPEKPEFNEGFVCWTDKEDNHICVTGKLTIKSFVAGEE